MMKKTLSTSMTLAVLLISCDAREPAEPQPIEPLTPNRYSVMNISQSESEAPEEGESPSIEALGSLDGESVGQSRGFGGLGLSGTGRGGAAMGLGTLGRGKGDTSMEDAFRGSRGVTTGKLGAKNAGLRSTGSAIGMGSKVGIGALRDASAPPTPTPVVPEPAQREEYTNHGVNKMTQTAKDRFSTFSVDVDTGSYTIARRKLNEGVVPPAASVRVEEFINYFSYRYPTPDAGAFGVNMEAAPSPFSSDKSTYLLRVGVQGKRIPASQRKPVHLTFLVDVSGSMNRPDKLGLAKASLKMLTKQLRKGDSVALVTYAGANKVVLPMTPATNTSTILKAIDNLRSGGGTAMASGMKLAYQQAMNASRVGHVNRVLVLSDGDANIGASSHGKILEQIRAYVDEGVTLTTVGFGMGNYRDTLMEQLANKGNGNYYYIDSMKEARKVFSDQANGTLEVIAKDVKLQVEFNPKAISAYRLIGYENRDIADRDFRNDKVDAGEIGAGHSVTALYEIKVSNADVANLGYVRVRAKKPDGYKAAEQTFSLNGRHMRTKLNQASKDFQFAASVAGFAELLRKSPYSKHLSFDLIHEVAQGSLDGKSERKEFLALVKKAKALKR